MAEWDKIVSVIAAAGISAAAFYFVPDKGQAIAVAMAALTGIFGLAGTGIKKA